MAQIRLQLPLTREMVAPLRAGDEVLISGDLYTARDAAHKRLVQCLQDGQPLPFDVRGQLIYYVGPAPASPGHAVGAAGPTTSYRMDAYSPYLIKECGLTGMIGKGKRNDEVVNAMKEYGAVYFGAIGGAGALLSQSVVKSEIVAYEDLGAEALHRLEVKDMPLTVVIDCYGENLYKTGVEDYLRQRDEK